MEINSGFHVSTQLLSQCSLSTIKFLKSLFFPSQQKKSVRSKEIQSDNEARTERPGQSSEAKVFTNLDFDLYHLMRIHCRN